VLSDEEIYGVDRTRDSAAGERLGKQLKGLRARAGLTQTALAQRLGVRQSVVSEYECGKRRIDVLELRAIAVEIGRPAAAVVAQLDALDALLAALGE
jgi:transcriptional regulator with XRE-family HTH domain